MQITRNFTTTETDSGQTRFVFRAQVARIYAGNVTRAENIQVDFYDRGKQVSVLTARQGFLDADGRMTAKGDAKVVANEGAILQTETLYWDRDRQKIRSEEFVRVTKGRDVLTGYGLTAGPNLDLIEIDRDVNATVVGKPEAKAR